MSDYVISCCSTADLTKEHFEKRNISYICFHYELNGKEYGFDFEITNSELDLYNCSYTSVKDKINYSFERIN